MPLILFKKKFLFLSFFSFFSFSFFSFSSFFHLSQESNLPQEQSRDVCRICGSLIFDASHSCLPSSISPPQEEKKERKEGEEEKGEEEEEKEKVSGGTVPKENITISGNPKLLVFESYYSPKSQECSNGIGAGPLYLLSPSFSFSGLGESAEKNLLVQNELYGEMLARLDGKQRLTMFFSFSYSLFFFFFSFFFFFGKTN